jgi:rhodanese-related sulfurtransferase
MSVVAIKPVLVSDEQHPVLAQARRQAAEEKLPYAGGIRPVDAWQLFAAGDAILLDVRSAEERKFVGHVAGSLHVPWQTGIALTKNPRFISELSLKVKKDTIVLLLCRSGKRSAAAAEAATKAGFRQVFNVLEGFEGDLDNQQRGRNNGWRFHQLPWLQD